MPTRFPQGTGTLAYRIKPAWSGKIEAVWWAVAANTAQRLFYGATSTTVITRTDSGCGFNSTDGRITGSNTVGSGTSFSDSTGTSTGIGGLTEDANWVFGVGYYGDLFNGAGATKRIMFGSRVPPDTLAGGAQIAVDNYDINTRVAGGGTFAISTSAGFANDVKDFMQYALKHNQADGTKDLRVWANGSENTSSGTTSVTPDKSTAIGSSTYPVYFGDTFTGTGNTVLEWEFAFIGTASLTASDLDSITSTGTNPADVLLEVVTTPPTVPTAGTATNLSAAGTATANWADNSSDETGFEVESAPGPSFSTWSAQGTVGVGVTSRAMSGLAAGDNRFRVRALGATNSAWSESATFVIPSWTYARPTADGTTTQWTTSSGTVHYSLLDESSPDDGDYVGAGAAGLIEELKFSMAAPQSGTSFELGYRVTGVQGDGAVIPKLYVGATLVKTDTTRTANGTYTMTVTSSDYAGVGSGDWADVTLRFESA